MKKPKAKKKHKRTKKKTEPALIAEQQKLKDAIFEGVPKFIPETGQLETPARSLTLPGVGLMQVSAPLNPQQLQIQALRNSA